MPADQRTEITTFSQSESDWWTPQWIIEACRRALGWIDLDPASSPEANERVRAAHIFTKEDNGLAQPWDGNIFLNPPSCAGDPLARPMLWAEKLFQEYSARRVLQATLIVKSNLGYNWYEDLYKCLWVCHLHKLPKFLKGGKEVGRAKKGVSVFYFGHYPERFYTRFVGLGKIVPPEYILNRTIEKYLEIGDS